MQSFEIKQGFNDDPYVDCPLCDSPGTLNRVPQSLLHASVRLSTSEIKNLGHLAERNTTRMSEDERVYRDHQHETKKIDPRGNILSSGMTREKVVKDKEKKKLHKKLNKMSPEQKKRYIETGNET